MLVTVAAHLSDDRRASPPSAQVEPTALRQLGPVRSIESHFSKNHIAVRERELRFSRFEFIPCFVLHRYGFENPHELHSTG